MRVLTRYACPFCYCRLGGGFEWLAGLGSEIVGDDLDMNVAARGDRVTIELRRPDGVTLTRNVHRCHGRCQVKEPEATGTSFA